MAWVMVADGFHPSLAVALDILPPGALAAVGTMALGRVLPSDRSGGRTASGSERPAEARKLRKAG